jgi:hypothetical protein
MQAIRTLCMDQEETIMLRRILFAAGVSYLFRRFSGRRTTRGLGRY